MVSSGIGSDGMGSAGIGASSSIGGGGVGALGWAGSSSHPINVRARNAGNRNEIRMSDLHY
jgi:hypothetical protein